MNAVTQPLSLQNLDITDTDLYVQHGYPWAAWDLLREQAPVFWYQRPRHEPFWAITKHADIGFISRNPDLFFQHPAPATVGCRHNPHRPARSRS